MLFKIRMKQREAAPWQLQDKNRIEKQRTKKKEDQRPQSLTWVETDQQERSAQGVVIFAVLIHVYTIRISCEVWGILQVLSHVFFISLWNV